MADILAAVLREEPDWSALAGRAPARLERLLRRCLEKKASAATARHRRRGDRARGPAARSSSPQTQAAAPRRSRSRDRLDAGASPRLGAARARRMRAGALALGLGAGLALRRAPATLDRARRRCADSPKRSPPRAARRSTRSRSPTTDASSPSRRPTRDVRCGSVASTRPRSRRCPGTEQGEFPFFSPDGEWLAFFTGFENALKKMPTNGGGQVVTLADGLRRNWGGSWGPDGRIVFHSQSGGEGLSRVSELGGPDRGADQARRRGRREQPSLAAGPPRRRRHRVHGVEGKRRRVRDRVPRRCAPMEQPQPVAGHFRALSPDRPPGLLRREPHDGGAVRRRSAARSPGPPVPVQSVESAGPWGYRTVATTPDGLQVQALRPPSRLLWVTQDGAESEIALPRGELSHADGVARRHAHRAGAGGGWAQRRHLDLRSRRRQPDPHHHPRREHVAGVDARRRVAAVLVRARRHPHRLSQALRRHRRRGAPGLRRAGPPGRRLTRRATG